MRVFPKGSASCHTLIFRDAEESLSRRFSSLFGLGVGIEINDALNIEEHNENHFCFRLWEEPLESLRMNAPSQ